MASVNLSQSWRSLFFPMPASGLYSLVAAADAYHDGRINCEGLYTLTDYITVNFKQWFNFYFKKYFFSDLIWYDNQIDDQKRTSLTDSSRIWCGANLKQNGTTRPHWSNLIARPSQVSRFTFPYFFQNHWQ